MGRAKAAGPPLEASVVDLSHDGRGIARVQGKAVFIPGALPQERVRCRLVRRRRDYDEAELLEILEACADRVTPVCEHFGVCGGCSLQHLEAGAQRRWKQKVLLDNLARIGHISPARVFEPVSGKPWGYRRKARLGAKYVDKKGRLLVGFREKGKPYIADLKQCEVLIPEVGKRLTALEELIASLSVYRSIPQIEVAGADAQTALVFRHLQTLSEADKEKLIRFAQQYDFAVYLQGGGPNSVTPLYPDHPQLTYSIAGHDIRLAFEPTDFVQVNRDINDRMVERVLCELAPARDERVLELFSGLGNFTLPLAQRVASVTAVEGEASLVARARENARRNDLDNINHHVANLADEVTGLPWLRDAAYDKVLLDPPRSGAAALLGELGRLRPERIVYVSCNPSTLARDARVLVNEYGYRLGGAGILDMFPHTAHVESMAVFDRR